MKPRGLLIFLALLACSSSDSTGAGGGAGHGAGGNAGTGGDPGVSARVVFVTSTSQDADFGGIEGADALCASQAAAAGLTGDFRAWLSTVDSPVADRFVQSTGPYVLVNGTRIANDWADLTDATIQAFIDLDATGDTQGGDVWTGTLPSGLAYTGSDCDGFTNGGAGITGLCGTTQAFNYRWTANQYPSCDTALRLFCFQQ